MRHPNKGFYGALQAGKRSQGGQKKRDKDTFKGSLKDFDIHRGDQSGVAPSTKEKLIMKKREAMKLNESAENAKPRPMGHQQIS